MTALIGGKSCRSCEFILIVGKGGLFCRRHPPMAFGIAMPGPQGPVLTVHSSYPPVNPDMPCGEYQRSELNAAAELSEAKPGNGEIAIRATP